MGKTPNLHSSRWALTSEEDNDKFVAIMLERLGIDYFDVFLVHNINTPWFKVAESHETFEYVKKMKENGIAKKIGFRLSAPGTASSETAGPEEGASCRGALLREEAGRPCGRSALPTIVISIV